MFYVVLAVACALYLLYGYLNSTYGYWKKRNVPFHPPVTFFGNLRDAVLMKKALSEVYDEIYNSHKDASYVGYYKIQKPGLIMRNPEIIKDILTKDFHSFAKNDVVVDENVDPIASKNPFFQYGQRWKTSRSQLSYCFSSGKMKHMFPLVVAVTDNMVKYIENGIKLEKNPFDAKELSSQFTSDSVATCAFGIDGKAFEDLNSEFLNVGRKALRPSFLLSLKLLIVFLFPSCAKLLKVRFVPEDAAEYFKSVVKATLQFRKENNVVRNDFLDAITQMKLNIGFLLNIDDIVAHAVSFFGDGFETSSIALSFFLYDMAANPHAQRKLRDEVNEVMKNQGGTITYEAIQEMNYLDRAVAETLRLHPPAPFLSKTCTFDFHLPPSNAIGKYVTIEEGTPIIIPVYSLHRDPKYFPNPEEFDPDRFSDSNKANIVRGSYLPFGEGHRLCIGMKFAILQVKAAAVAIIRNFEVHVNQKTKEPLKIDPNSLLLLAKGGLWLDFHKLND